MIQICNIQLSISQKIPTIPPIRPSPLVCGGEMAISVFPLYYIVRNTIFRLKQSQGLKTLVAHSLYPNSPLVYPQYEKQKYITPGGCSEGVKTRENLKALMLKNGHCHLWRQSFKRVSNQ